ncbi:MAG: type II toxin-antitoxin system RatA family toxin [Clostridia bacterium]
MPRVEVELSIKSPSAPIYEVLAASERFPEFMKSVESIRVVDRGDGFAITEWVARLRGARFRWVERDDFRENRIDYQQLEGDLKQFEGAWELYPEDGGTRVRLVTDFEFGLPMLSSLLNPVAKVTLRDNALAMLEAIRSRVES